MINICIQSSESEVSLVAGASLKPSIEQQHLYHHNPSKSLAVSLSQKTNSTQPYKPNKKSSFLSKAGAKKRDNVAMQSLESTPVVAITRKSHQLMRQTTGATNNGLMKGNV